MPGLEEASSPVYRQAHSKEVFMKGRSEEKILAKEYLLYRCDRLVSHINNQMPSFSF